MQCVLDKVSFVFVFYVFIYSRFSYYYFCCSWLMSVFVPISYILTVPVDSALVSHSRSLSLNGKRTRLTPRFTSTALSGYRKWCVVLFPTSFSNPLVMALFILRRRGKEGASWRRERWGKGVTGCDVRWRRTYRITESWESICLPLSDCRSLPELPTTAQVRHREGRGLKSSVGEEMTRNISDSTSSRVWPLPDRWSACREVAHSKVFK